MKAELVPENGDPPIPIDRDVTVIGRREYCDVVIDHSSLSKRHCVLVKTDGLLVIRDLISTNGTKVKGQKIRWAALLPDDRITLGSYKIRVYLGPDDVPGPSELHRARDRRNAAGRRGPVAEPRGAGAGSWVAVAETQGATGMPAGGLTNGTFAEPSPIEIPAASSVERPATPSAGRRKEHEPLIPIVLDDSDEIIELD
jgi:predicted component of type VI protein secretion system